MQTIPVHARGFAEISRADVATVGGKGAQLAELSLIEGIRVPPGFCVTTDAFGRVMAVPSIDDQLEQLAHVDPADREAIRALSERLRGAIEGIGVPDDVAEEITGALARLGDDIPYAVRSSATAEDLPSASFAGQHDSFLGVLGRAAVLEHVSRCWASLFTERAVTYRLRNGVDHRTVRMAVVVQQMAAASAAGVLFTADPLTSNRKVASVEATAGLGEELVSGRVDPDRYSVRDGEVVTATVGAAPVLTDEQVVRLVELGRRIEAHFGSPQDIEWCLVGDDFVFVQSRPITTLFPIPDVGDGEPHVFVSVGHQQMMTDPMKPLGLSVWLLTTPAPMYTAAGRLFVDVTRGLASPATRAGLLQGFARSDPLIGDALQTIVERGDVLPPPAGEQPGGPLPGGAVADPIETDSSLVTELIERTQASLAAVQRDIRGLTGSALLDFIRDDIQELRRVLFDPQSHRVLMAGFEAVWWLNDQLLDWLGEKNAADALIQSVPHDVTSEMGLALLDVADAIRPHPDVVAFLRDVGVDDVGFLDELPKLPGGTDARAAIDGWLERYGMRCVGEIDITRPRWRERPGALLPVLLGHVDHLQPGEAARRFEHGQRVAAATEREVLARLQSLPDGDQKAGEVKRMIDRARTFIGYREYPKYGMVSRYFVYKQALVGEADRLVLAGVLREREDIGFLTFQELQEVVRTQRVDHELIERRRDEFAAYHALTPPRVLTSDGEIVTGAYRRDDLPDGALAGLAVSAGIVEGRARVVLDMAEADVEPGDILVTAHTDPSWSPLFVGIAGLVTEVGGLMTHGAVVAREYGLPAVVGVEGATQRIRDGQWIRVNGTDGYVELIETAASPAVEGRFTPV